MEMTTQRIADLGVQIFGTQKPREEEIAKAKVLLNSAPTGSAPLEIARYFLDLPDKNGDGEAYNAEWRTRSNPMIVSFFGATNDVNEGHANDETPWCAAFVNWCLRRAAVKGTASASSGSFRCKGVPATSPQPGDIAVFKRDGHDEPCSGRGHVGFWLRQTETHHIVLGGNQSDRVKQTSYPKTKTDGWPELLSIRRL